MADQNEQHRASFEQTGNLLRQARPEISAVRLDEIKRDVLARRGSTRLTRGTIAVIRRRVLALTLFVMLFAISTSNAAAQVLNFISAGTLSKTLGVTGKTSGTQFFFGTLHFGGDHSDDAGHHTYCKDDGKGSDGHSTDGGHHNGGKDGSSSDGGGKGSYGSKGSSSKSGFTTSIHTTTTTHTGGSQGTDHSSSDGKDPCKPRDDHSSSDGKGSDGTDHHGTDHHGTDHHDGKDDKYGGKDDKSGGKSGGKDDKSGGKSGGKSGKG